MLPLHQKIVDEIVAEYKDQPSTVAITLFGSLGRGEGREGSDVDIEIVSDSAQTWELRQNERRYGIKIDLVICPKAHRIHQVEDYPFLCYDFLAETVLYDPTGFVRELMDRLRVYFDAHPEVVAFYEKDLERMRADKAAGRPPRGAMRAYDEAEILFSPEHRVTRDFFRS